MSEERDPNNSITGIIIYDENMNSIHYSKNNDFVKRIKSLKVLMSDSKHRKIEPVDCESNARKDHAA